MQGQEKERRIEVIEIFRIGLLSCPFEETDGQVKSHQSFFSLEYQPAFLNSGKGLEKDVFGNVRLQVTVDVFSFRGIFPRRGPGQIDGMIREYFFDWREPEGFPRPVL